MTASVTHDGALSPAIEARNIKLKRGGRTVLDDVSIAIPAGQVLCIVGPSGAGKSTMLRVLNLLVRVDCGSVYMFGRPIMTASMKARRSFLGIGPSHSVSVTRFLVRPELHRRTVGMVFQEFNLWEDRSILANLTEGPRHAAGVQRGQANDEAKALLRQFDLEHLESRRPEQLSGGERQRVALIRALLMKPAVLLLDEVTSSVDPENIAVIHNMLRRLVADGLTMAIVTHHLEFARKIASQVVMMADGQVVETGLPEKILVSPTSERTRNFILRLEDSK